MDCSHCILPTDLELLNLEIKTLFLDRETLKINKRTRQTHEKDFIHLNFLVKGMFYNENI